MSRFIFACFFAASAFATPVESKDLIGMQNTCVKIDVPGQKAQVVAIAKDITITPEILALVQFSWFASHVIGTVKILTILYWTVIYNAEKTNWFSAWIGTKRVSEEKFWEKKASCSSVTVSSPSSSTSEKPQLISSNKIKGLKKRTDRKLSVDGKSIGNGKLGDKSDKDKQSKSASSGSVNEISEQIVLEDGTVIDNNESQNNTTEKKGLLDLIAESRSESVTPSLYYLVDGCGSFGFIDGMIWFKYRKEIVSESGVRDPDASKMVIIGKWRTEEDNIVLELSEKDIKKDIITLFKSVKSWTEGEWRGPNASKVDPDESSIFIKGFFGSFAELVSKVKIEEPRSNESPNSVREQNRPSEEQSRLNEERIRDNEERRRFNESFNESLRQSETRTEEINNPQNSSSSTCEVQYEDPEVCERASKELMQFGDDYSADYKEAKEWWDSNNGTVSGVITVDNCCNRDKLNVYCVLGKDINGYDICIGFKGNDSCFVFDGKVFHPVKIFDVIKTDFKFDVKFVGIRKNSIETWKMIMKERIALVRQYIAIKTYHPPVATQQEPVTYTQLVDNNNEFAKPPFDKSYEDIEIRAQLCRETKGNSDADNINVMKINDYMSGSAYDAWIKNTSKANESGYNKKCYLGYYVSGKTQSLYWSVKENKIVFLVQDWQNDAIKEVSFNEFLAFSAGHLSDANFYGIGTEDKEYLDFWRIYTKYLIKKLEDAITAHKAAQAQLHVQPKLPPPKLTLTVKERIAESNKYGMAKYCSIGKIGDKKIYCTFVKAPNGGTEIDWSCEISEEEVHKEKIFDEFLKKGNFVFEFKKNFVASAHCDAEESEELKTLVDGNYFDFIDGLCDEYKIKQQELKKEMQEEVMCHDKVFDAIEAVMKKYGEFIEYLKNIKNLAELKQKCSLNLKEIELFEVVLNEMKLANSEIQKKQEKLKTELKTELETGNRGNIIAKMKGLFQCIIDFLAAPLKQFNNRDICVSRRLESIFCIIEDKRIVFDDGRRKGKKILGYCYFINGKAFFSKDVYKDYFLYHLTSLDFQHFYGFKEIKQNAGRYEDVFLDKPESKIMLDLFTSIIESAKPLRYMQLANKVK